MAPRTWPFLALSSTLLEKRAFARLEAPKIRETGGRPPDPQVHAARALTIYFMLTSGYCGQMHTNRCEHIQL
jgi:hypothetical protein